MTRRGAALVAFLGLALLPGPAGADAGGVDEYALKAAFLYNFTRFVEWPDSAFETPDSPFRICVLGSDPFNARLDALGSRRVGQRPIAIERLRPPADLRRCQIAYFGEGAPDTYRTDALDGAAPLTLTVASERGFAREGGMMSLVTGRGRVQLHVNLQVIQASPLKFSAKLLEVAEVRHAQTVQRE